MPEFRQAAELPATRSHLDARVLLKHPGWSQRQAECCLYWQGTARKRLGEIIDEFMVWASGDYNPENGVAFLVPEAHGLNVTATMKSIGIELEWPPKTVAYQVAIASVGEKRA
jgi:hypothetical protein